MSDENIRVVEINGAKLEVDLRTAKRVDQFRVGDRVKVLVKNYSGYEAHHGVIVAFDDFKNLPTITVCYLSGFQNGDLKFAAINAESKDAEIAACNDDVLVEKGEIVARINSDINAKLAEVEDLRRRLKYFEERFGAWFKPEEKSEE